MLFAIKNRVVPTCFLAFVFFGASVWLRYELGLSWDLHFTTNVIFNAAVGLSGIVAINLALHGILRVLMGSRYLKICWTFLEYFKCQEWPHFLAAGFLAATEEMVFRGILLEGIRTLSSLGSGWAIFLSALLFGIFHIIPKRRFTLFFAWAILEGLLLGVVYCITNSLVTLMLMHAVNDAMGYALFSIQRRMGWLLQKKDPL